MRERKPGEALSRRWRVADRRFECESPPRDQVVADVMRTIMRAVLAPGPGSHIGRCAGDLGFLPLRPFGQSFHRVAVAVARRKVHPAIGADWILTKNLFDQADALEEQRPVD